MTNLEKFREQWAGREFACLDTGETLTIPSDVRECDFFSFGNCFIDVGRFGFYSRMGGNIKEKYESN